MSGRLLGPAGLGSLRALGPLLFLAAFAALKISFGILICDDAYITLAHARSWNAGLGPIMSALNPVCATSTPLHTMVLAAEAALLRSHDYVPLAYFTNLAWDLLGLAFLHRIASRGLRMAPPYALAATAAYALSVNFLAVSAYGMETPMYAALALAGTWFALYSPRPMPGLLAVSFLAPLARPEGALLPAALVLLNLRKDRIWRRAFACAGAAALGFAAFFAFYRYAYGHWLPHSVVAKRLEIHVGFADALYSWILNVFYKGPSLGGVTAVTLANLLAMAGAAAGFRRARRADGIPWELLAWPGLYFLFFIATRSSYILFTWYYLPVLPFLLVFIVCGLERLAAGRLGESAAWALVFAFLALVPWQTHRQKLPAKHRFAEEAREGRYREAARILDSIAGPSGHPLVMIDEVGALGYYSTKIRILDSHGLLSPEALPYLAGGPDTYFTRMAAMQDKFDPEWILAMRLLQDEGQWHIGEDGLFSGYEIKYILRRPPHGYNFEMWRRTRAE